MFAISIDAEDKTSQLIKKIEGDGKGKLGFPILSDPDHKVIDSYGLFDARYVGRGVEGIPKPAIFIMDKNRKITWVLVEEDYRSRPKLEDVRGALDKATGTAGNDRMMKDKSKKTGQ